MRSLLGFFVLFAAFSTEAKVISSKIHDVDLTKSYEHHLVLLMSGDVIKVPAGDQDLTKSLVEAKNNKSLIHFNVNEDREIISLQTLESEELDHAHINLPEVLSYEPSDLATDEEALRIFKGLNNRYRGRSECYNRAHVWSYESLQKHGLNSMKVFLFFTRKYIRDYNYHWWFHVSPFTYVNGVERVLDYEFSYGPLGMKRWTDIFMKPKTECPSISKYSDYSQHEYENWCYIYKTSMYYYQPLDLEALENHGTEKTNWINWEVNNAYRQGF